TEIHGPTPDACADDRCASASGIHLPRLAVPRDGAGGTEQGGLCRADRGPVPFGDQRRWSMKNWSRIAGWGLAGLITLNIAGAAYYLVLQSQIRGAQTKPSMVAGSIFPEFSGTDVLGSKWTAGAAPCRVIRITDD